MGTWNGFTFGGGGGTGGGSVGVALSSIVTRAYRIAGMFPQPGSTPGVDKYGEAIPELNAMIGGMNCDRLNIFTVAINAFNISGGTKAFLVGTGAVPQTIDGVAYGAFDMARPQAIQNGVIALGPVGSNNLVRMPPMYQMNDAEWATISLQDIPNGVPLSFYYDGSYDPSTGFGVIFLWTQTTNSYSVEWYTWQALPTFQSQADMVALPPGYEDHFVYALAERIAALNPHQAKMSPDSYRLARQAKYAIRKLNAPLAKPFQNDASNLGNAKGIGYWDYRLGGTRF